MKKVTFAIVGMGNRGTVYASKQLKYPEEMQVVAVCDNRRERLDNVKKMLSLPEDSLFSSFDEMLKKEKLADVMIVATGDSLHREHAIAALEKGYDLILEKPIATTFEDCVIINETAKRLGRRVLVCHVLRYTPFYSQIKKVIDEGTIGKVKSINATEKVGYYHYAHSYVRGNWHREETSSPMILAKSCHDLDILLWLSGAKCTSISSFGSLDFFKAENCPEGATERCTDGCPIKDCPFNAPDFYISRIPGWPTTILNPNPTKENMIEACKTTNYGKCVFKMDNDVVDHQTVNLLFDDNTTAVFTMSGFTARQTREIDIMGTKGEIFGVMADRKFTVALFGQKPYEIDLNEICDDFSGHGGGDNGLIHDAIRYFRGDDFNSESMTTLDKSVESHILAFAAEASRKNGGNLVNVEEFKNNHR